jgi:uncharacterized membrane protein YfcA
LKIKELWVYVAGFTLGVALSVIIATWGEATITYRIVYIVLLGLLLLATWSKRKPYNRNNNANNDPLQTVVSKPTNKSNNSTN